MPASSTITIERSKLAGALKSAAAVCEGRNTIPILANVLLQAADGTLELVTTDLDCELRQRVPLATPGELATTVDAKRLAAIALATDEGAQITLALEDGRLTVTAGRSRFNLPIRPSNDFPTIARNEPAHSVEMPGKDLAAMLARVAPSVSTEATKYYMAGAFLNDEAGKLRLVSTDGHRLAAVDCAVDWPAAAPEVILPSKAVRELRSLFAEADRVSLAWSDRLIVANAGEVTFISKTIDGTFPDYRRVIPAAIDSPIRFDPETVLRALRRITAISAQKTRAVKLQTRSDCLVLTSTSPEFGSACEEVPAECADGHETGFNGAYLAQMLETVGGDTVEMHHADAGAPCLFRRTVGGDTLGVVMPLRV